MIAIEKSQEPNVRSAFEADLRVERTDIWFEDVAQDRVRIQVTVYNAGEQRSRPTSMRIEAAPLGAFVPWRPLAVLAVPVLEPGQSRELSTEVPRPHPAPLGDFNRVPPKRVLTALNSAEQPASQRDAGLWAVLNLIRKGPTGLARAGRSAMTTALPPDFMELLGRGPTHWAGNINIFIGTRSVERHMAKALRIYAGRTNLAMFMVGEPAKPDAYAFELMGLAPDWKAALYDSSKSRALVVSPSDSPIQQSEWLESNGGLVILATHPPVDCQRGNVEVHVTRRSCGKTAIVEFNLDPAAQGAGCYFM